MGMAKVKKHYRSIEVYVNLNDRDYTVKAKCWGYFDPGKTYGLPENCYPPEGDFEANDIEIKDDETGELIQFDSLYVVQQKLVEEKLEEMFFKD